MDALPPPRGHKLRGGGAVGLPFVGP